MNVWKRVVAALICLATVVWTLWISQTTELVAKVDADNEDKDSVILWYTDETLTDYLSAVCVEYNEKNGVRVIPKLQSGDEYLESINEASIKDEGMPDIYLTSNDMLERAYLSGLASVIIDDSDDISTKNYPDAALQSVTYKGNKVAYPFYFETSALLYNRSYLYEMANNQLMADESVEPDEGGDGLIEETAVAEDEIGLSQEEKIEKRIQKAIPETFDDLLNFANTYDAPAEVEAIFKWDVKDIFYNYFFVGDYMDVGGENGDDSSIIDIYNMNAITALTVYQELNQFFSFDYEDITYSSIIDEFMQGKLIFTTATSDVIMKLEEAKAAGEFEYEYGLTEIPNLNDVLTTKSMSVTNVVVINGYSDQKELANSFAKYLVLNSSGNLYDMTGKLSTNCNVEYENDFIYAFVNEYANSRPVPKMMATTNYWLQAEIAFSNIWAGKSVSEQLKNLSEQIKEQVTGMEISEDYIDMPVKDEGEQEYYDEDAEREAAQGENESDDDEEE